MDWIAVLPEVAKYLIPALIGFLLGRLSKHLDERSEARKAGPKWELTHSGKMQYVLTNTGASVRSASGHITDGLFAGNGRLEGTDGIDFPTGHGESFVIVRRGDGLFRVTWKSKNGKPAQRAIPIPAKVPGTDLR